MNTIESTIEKKETLPQRIIQKVKGEKRGPTLIFFAGIHGNEMAGVLALQETLEEVHQLKGQLRGTVYGILGNTTAISQSKRYIDQDLNRLWTKKNVKIISNKKNPTSEEKELLEILDLLQEIIKTESSPFYFIDYHTTSSKSVPFITINDSMINRKLAHQFPVPTVLGIEEFLDGPLLSYINQLGYVALGFEAGQHRDPSSVANCKAFTYRSLTVTGMMDERELKNNEDNANILQVASENMQGIFEVLHLHKIAGVDLFRMNPGFESFQKIDKGTLLAMNNGQPVYSPMSGLLFMPLYQNQGSDGFFIIGTIPRYALKLSAFLRKIKIDNLFTLLPGVSWENKEKEILRIDLKVAKYMAKDLFHLLGYRVRQLDAQYLHLYNREKASKKKMYKKEPWW